MKHILSVSLALILSTPLLRAQDAEPAGGSGTPDQSSSTVAEGEGQDEEKLVKLEPESASEWTNSIGLVLVKTGAGLWAGKYEVTQEEYKAVTGGNPSAFAGERRPVDSVSWNDALAFCSKMTQLDQEKELLPDGYGYALPTEQQWLALATGATLENAVTSEGESRSETAPVGSKGAGPSGLHDVRGNVWEWVLDGFNPDYNYRILRGAAWSTDFEVNLRTNFRFYAPPADAKDDFGFRVVLVKGLDDNPSRTPVRSR